MRLLQLRQLLSLTALALLPGLGADAAFAQIQVRVEPVILAPIVEQLPLSGSILSPRFSDVAPQESGVVEQMAVDAGDHVEQGDVLLQLDKQLTLLELQRLLAMQEETQLGYDEARRLADEALRLVKDRNISKTEYDSRLSTEAAGETQLRQLDLQIQMQRVRIDHRTLRAPFSGVIGFKHTEVGQWLDAGSAAYQLVQLDPVRVQARIPERYYAEVKPGTGVTISLDAYPGELIKATVDSVIPVTDIDTRSFTARMDVPNPKHLLAPGMSAHLVFLLGGEASRPVLQVPADAIVRRSDGGAAVWVVRDNTAQSITVTVGRREHSHVEVRAENLREGDLTVTLGNESLQHGQNVTVVRG